MKKFLTGALGVLAALSAWAENDPLNAVVKVETVTTVPNFIIPWQNKLQRNGSGSGVVITGNQILTNAHNVANNTLISIRKQNEDAIYVAKVTFVDHDSDLALLTVEDANFFVDITPFELGETPPPQSQVLAAGFPMGGDGISLTQGIISRIEVQSYTHSLKKLLAAQLDAAINPGNSGGPVFYEGKVVGIVFQGISQGDGLGYMIPDEIIRHFLTDIKDGKVDGVGSIGFEEFLLENPGARDYLKMSSDQTGIMVKSVMPGTDQSKLKANDVILAIDGKTIANNGNIRLPNGQPRNLTTVISQKQVGENVTLTLLRDGKVVNVEMPVRKPNNKVQDWLHDQVPEYYMVGGLIFTNLSFSYLNEWEKNTPPEELLAMLGKENDSPDEEVVVLSIVLGDEVNIGYQDFFATRLLSVNGIKVKNMKHLIELVEKCETKHITFMFTDDNPIIMDTAKMRESTKRIMERYRVPADRHLK